MTQKCVGMLLAARLTTELRVGWQGNRVGELVVICISGWVNFGRKAN